MGARGEQRNEWGKKQKRMARRMGFGALKGSNLFHHTASSTLKLLAKHFKPIDYRAGEYIIKQGDVGLRFFVIINGRVGVYAKGVKVATLKRGQIMGERSLIRDDKTSASCVAEMKTQCVYIGRKAFHSVFEQDDIDRFQQVAIQQDLLSRGNTRDYSHMNAAMQGKVMSRVGQFKNRFSKSKKQRGFTIFQRQKRSKFYWGILRNHTKTLIALRTPALKGLPEAAVSQVMSGFTLQRYSKYAKIYKKGDKALYGYIVVGGSVNIRGTIMRKNRVIPAPLRTARRGEDFGLYMACGDLFETSTTYSSNLSWPEKSDHLPQLGNDASCWRRYYSAKAGRKGALVFRFDKQTAGKVFNLYKSCGEDFNSSLHGLVKASVARRLGAKMFLVQHHPILKAMLPSESAVLFDGNICQVREFPPGTVLCEKGTPAEMVRYILQGEALVNDMAPAPRALTMTDRMHGKLSVVPELIERKCASNVVALGPGATFGAKEVLNVREKEIRNGPNVDMVIQERLWRTKYYTPYSKGLQVGSMSTSVLEMDQTLLMGHTTCETMINLRKDVIIREHWRRKQLKSGETTHMFQREMPFLKDIAEAHNVCCRKYAFGNYLDMLTASLVRPHEIDAPPKLCDLERSLGARPSQTQKVTGAGDATYVPKPIAIFSHSGPVRKKAGGAHQEDVVTELSKTIWKKEGGVTAHLIPHKPRMQLGGAGKKVHNRGRRPQAATPFRRLPHGPDPPFMFSKFPPKTMDAQKLDDSARQPLGDRYSQTLTRMMKNKSRQLLSGSFVGHKSNKRFDRQQPKPSALRVLLTSREKPTSPFTPVYFDL